MYWSYAVLAIYAVQAQKPEENVQASSHKLSADLIELLTILLCILCRSLQSCLALHHILVRQSANR